MMLSRLTQFGRFAVAAGAVLLLLSAPAAHATRKCKTLDNGKFCVDDYIPSVGRAWMGSYEKFRGSRISGYMQLETRPVDYF